MYAMKCLSLASKHARNILSREFMSVLVMIIFFSYLLRCWLLLKKASESKVVVIVVTEFVELLLQNVEHSFTDSKNRMCFCCMQLVSVY